MTKFLLTLTILFTFLLLIGQDSHNPNDFHELNPFRLAADFELETHQPANVDYAAFLSLAQEVQSHRAERLEEYKKWIAMSKDPNTIILDTRSKTAYDQAHIKGAIHLDFSDFTEYKLNNIIPSKETRILIYCANNFHGNSILTQGQISITPNQDLAAFRGKGIALTLPKKNKQKNGLIKRKYKNEKQSPNLKRFRSYNTTQETSKPIEKSPVALNIPTYINLYYYGYKNVYELSSSLDTKDSKLELEGSLASFR